MVSSYTATSVYLKKGGAHNGWSYPATPPSTHHFTSRASSAYLINDVGLHRVPGPRVLPIRLILGFLFPGVLVMGLDYYVSIT